MTRKHYKAIAKALKQHASRIGETSPETNFVALIHDLADTLQADNPNFDRKRFYAAIWE